MVIDGLGDHEQAVRRFNGVVWPCLPAVLRLARLLTNDAAEAEDLAQETMMKAFAAIGRYQDGTDVRAWLFTILRNTRIDRARAAASRVATVSLEQVQREPEGDESADTAADPESAWHDPRAMLEALSDQQVIEALNRLPEDIRWTLLLVDVEGLDLQQAAEILGVPVGTVKSRTHRGRKTLREALLPLAREMRLPGASVPSQQSG